MRLIKIVRPLALVFGPLVLAACFVTDSTAPDNAGPQVNKAMLANGEVMQAYRSVGAPPNAESRVIVLKHNAAESGRVLARRSIRARQAGHDVPA